MFTAYRSVASQFIKNTNLNNSDIKINSKYIAARRSEATDSVQLGLMIDDHTRAYFGRVNVLSLIEKSLLSVTLINEDNEILGNACFNDYPCFYEDEYIVQNWTHWLKENFELDEHTRAKRLNTLFLHFFVAPDSFKLVCLLEAIRVAFNVIIDLQQIFLSISISTDLYGVYEQVFREIFPIKGSSEIYRVFITKRKDHFPMLYIREARVEDNDDIMKVFEKHTHVKGENYGQYFVANTILFQDETKKSMVAEVNGKCIGFMSLEIVSNLDLLNKCYILEPFNGMREPTQQDVSPMLKRVKDKNDAAKKDPIKELKPVVLNKEFDFTYDEISYTSLLDLEGNFVGYPNVDIFTKQSLSNYTFKSFDFNVVTTPSFNMFAMPPDYTQMEAFKYGPVAFYGKCLAVAIKMFCIEEKYKMRSCDFLVKVFDLFPDHRFVIISIPPTEFEFPLLQKFVKVAPLVTSLMPKELYLFHSAGLVDTFEVKTATLEDLERIKIFTSTMDFDTHEKLFGTVFMALNLAKDSNGNPLSVFVSLISNQIIGVAVLGAEPDIKYIQSHYCIDEFIYFDYHESEEHGHLYQFIINPIFTHYAMQFYKEIMLLARKTCLYYPVFPIYHEFNQQKNSVNHLTPTLLNSLIPIRARRQIDYPLEQLKDNAPSQLVLQQPVPFALFHLNTKLIYNSRVTVNTRIVVVGASDVGTAFLETLMYSPYLKFNNLTLVSPYGLQGTLYPSIIRDRLLPSSCCYTERNHCEMGLRANVKVVYDKIIEIHRQRKEILVDNQNAIIPYEYLILCPGEHFQVSTPLKVNPVTGSYDPHIVNSFGTRFRGPKINNALRVNTAYESAKFIHWVLNNMNSSHDKLVLYGNALEVYTVINSLLFLQAGVSSFVVFFPPKHLDELSSTFDDPCIEETMQGVLKNLSVVFYKNATLVKWSLKSNEISSMVFKIEYPHKDKEIKIDCLAFLDFTIKGPDYDAFMAANCSALVFDRYLVIDSDFRTNDPYIRGAGPFTKFKRAYFAEKWSHANFNSKEIGYLLAESLLDEIDPTREKKEEKDLKGNAETNLIPNYTQPKCLAAYLPGGYQYLHVKKPSACTSYDDKLKDPEIGRILQTGKPGQDDIGYFKIYLDSYFNIREFICFSKKPFSNSNLICLYGLHVKLLNDLLTRYNENSITDFFAFFEESWAMALYHDRFPELREEIREVFNQEEFPQMDYFIRRNIDNNYQLEECKKMRAFDYFKRSWMKKKIDEKILNFLSYNNYHLPMYAKPDVL